MFQKKILGHEGLGSAGPEESAQAAQQVKEDDEYVLHRGTLRSFVGLDKPAGALFDGSSYQFAIHRESSSLLQPRAYSVDSHSAATDFLPPTTSTRDDMFLVGSITERLSVIKGARLG